MQTKENHEELDLLNLIKRVWQQRLFVICCIAVGIILAIIVWASTPKVYNSQISIVFESSQNSNNASLGLLSGMLGNNSLNSMGGINEEIYPQILKSSPFLAEFAYIPVEYEGQKMNLITYLLNHTKYPWWRYLLSPGMIFSKDYVNPTIDNEQIKLAFASRLSSSIELKSEPKSKTNSICVKMQDPVISQIVVDTAYTRLHFFVANYKTAKARNNLDNSLSNFQEAKKKFYTADSIYAAMEDRNRNLISKAAKIKVDRLKSERDIAYSVYNQLATQVELDKIKVQEDTPAATIIEPSYLPTAHSLPNFKMLFVVFSFLGFVFGAAFVIVKDLIKS